MTNAFDAIPRTPRGHFVLHLYAAVFRLFFYVERLSAAGGEELGKLFERYPFLAAYFEEMSDRLPGESTWSEAAHWWREQILDWEAACTEHLPLRALAEDVGALRFGRRLAFVLAGLVEEDSRFGTLFAELQGPLTHRRPTLELLGHVALDPQELGEADAWALLRPLLADGFLRVADRQAPRAEWVLEVPGVLWDAARGEVAAEPLPGWTHRPAASFPALGDLPVMPEVGEELARIPDLAAAGRLRTVVLRGSPGADSAGVLGALARALGRGLLRAGGAGADSAPAEELGPLATLSRSLPVVAYELGPGETVTPPAPTGYSGPVGVVLGLEGGLEGPLTEGALTLVLEPPRMELRRRLWSESLGEHAGPALADIAERFHLDTGYLRRAAAGAVACAELAGRTEVAVDDVRRASRALGRQQLEPLAALLEAVPGWSRLVTGGGTLARLRELELRCRHRERLLSRLGPAFGNVSNRGVRAIFTGPSGTGKTLAARILAAELGLDLYRVDLSAVVNKYIGETEKNLHRVLARAEALDVVLLVDEGEALLGQRTAVRSANDRYANLETDFLLQRLETFQGIAVVTTNLGQQIDTAFKRRMDVAVPFYAPEAEERWRIFDLHLPADHGVGAGFLERVAVGCTLTGGQIRNVALHAALLALDDEAATLATRHLDHALRSEYRKAGAVYPLDGNGSTPPRRGTAEDLAAALAAT